MRIALTGGTGFLGTPLGRLLAQHGHEVAILTRRPGAAGNLPWQSGPGTVTQQHWTASPDTRLWQPVIDGCDVVVNLAGESIASARWTTSQKARLEHSRLDATRGIVQALDAAPPKPRRLISGSAVGYYGSRGDSVLAESSTPGDDFLAALAVKWEAAASRVQSARLTLIRTGMVLDQNGGALQKMLVPFRLGAGGPAGPGTQYMSWIHLKDWLRLVAWLVDTRAEGPFNLVAPHPVTNGQFATALGRALKRPAFLPAPAFALRLALGEMADGLLLASQRVVPERALDAGFIFEFPTLEAALGELFGG
ncbi:MAG: TIGR01777 family oxidoreductase [Vicinamibacterales bacterium]